MFVYWERWGASRPSAFTKYCKYLYELKKANWAQLFIALLA